MSPHEIVTIISLFSIGFVGGFSHCIGMCGPFVLIQTTNRLSQIDIKQANNFLKLTGIALIPYHLGRITTYCLIAVISSLISTNLKNFIGFKLISALFLIIAAMIIFSFATIKIKLPFKIKLLKILPIYEGAFLKVKLKKALNFLFINPAGFKGYLLGALLGFIPCGLVYAAIATVISLNSYKEAILGMLAFGAGTVPSLILTSWGSYWFLERTKKHLRVFTKLILLINVITLLVMAFGLILNRL